MTVGDFWKKTQRLIWAPLICSFVACGRTDSEPIMEPYDEAIFVARIPAELSHVVIQDIAAVIALPDGEFLAPIAEKNGLSEDDWKALLKTVKVDREHPYTSKPDLDAEGRHRLAWRVTGQTRTAAEKSALDDLRAVVELEVWERARTALDPALDVRASALSGPDGPQMPRTLGARARLALQRLESGGYRCERWLQVRRWSEKAE